MREQTVELLNQLLVIEYRSLPMYLMDATPWTHPGDEKATESLRSIVATQRSLAHRLAAAITARSGTVATGEYPMSFTDLNFLSLDYLLKELVRYNKLQVAAIEVIACKLVEADARELALEVLGAEKAHLEILQELSGELASSK